MKTTILHTKVQNKSQYPIDFVWENAKDLEHVAFLHGNTNKAFKLLHVEIDKNSPQEYNVLVYRALRRFHFFSFHTFGFRRIMADYNIHQLEYIPWLNMTVALNSVLKPTGDPKLPTLLLDEVVMELPFWLGPLKGYLTRALQRHTSIQCREDEAYRARRQLLKEKNINFPFSIFNLSQWSELTKLFTEHPLTLKKI